MFYCNGWVTNYAQKKCFCKVVLWETANSWDELTIFEGE